MSSYGVDISNIRLSESRPSQVATDKSGYLFKKSSKGLWNKRFFVASDGYLVYFKSNKSTKTLGAISLIGVGAIRLITEGASDAEKGTLFQLDLKDRQYLLRATTTREARDWIEVLVRMRDSRESMHSINVMHPKASDTFSDGGSSATGSQGQAANGGGSNSSNDNLNTLMSQLHSDIQSALIREPVAVVEKKHRKTFLCCC